MQIYKVILNVIISSLIGISMLSCEYYTPEEFKEKYDWAESTATYIDNMARRNNPYLFEFKYEDKRYRITILRSVAEIHIGYKYPILFDKKKPERNYKLLQEYPIIESPFICTVYGEIRRVVKDYDKILVWYNYYVISSGQKIKHKSCEYLPLEYLERCTVLKNEERIIPINLYDFEGMYIPFIDRTELIIPPEETGPETPLQIPP